jgi:putative ABC transport system substrate-binding protein
VSSDKWIRQKKTNDEKITVFTLCAMLFALCFSAQAQQPAKAYRIGYLRAEKAPEIDIAGFRQGLREHGYVEGKNIMVEYRWADGNEEKLRSLVSELINLKVDLIVTSAPAATQAAKDATTTPPI